MRPLFGVDITEDKENLKTAADLLYTEKRISPEKEKEIDDRTAYFDVIRKKMVLRPPLPMIKTIGGYFAILSAIMTMTMGGAAKSTRPALLVIAFLGLAVWGGLTYLEKKTRLAVLSSPDLASYTADMKKLVESAYEDLEVPAYAYDTDIILHRYQMKDGKAVPKAPALAPTAFFNAPTKVFKSGDNLSISDTATRYDIPLSEIKGITRVDKRMTLPSWNKDVSPRSPEYEKYGLKIGNNMLTMKYHYIIDIKHGNDEYGILIPSYEIETFKFLLNLTPSDGNTENKA